jgi:hypothetical protein
MGMRQRVIALFGSILLMILVMNVSGCVKLFGPSDEEIVKAINDTGLFSGGIERFTLKSPIVILEKGMFSSNGAWTVKVKFTYTYMMAGGHETKPTEKIQTFMISKSKDSSGNTIWKAKSGSQ